MGTFGNLSVSVSAVEILLLILLNAKSINSENKSSSVPCECEDNSHQDRGVGVVIGLAVGVGLSVLCFLGWTKILKKRLLQKETSLQKTPKPEGYDNMAAEPNTPKQPRFPSLEKRCRENEADNDNGYTELNDDPAYEQAVVVAKESKSKFHKNGGKENMNMNESKRYETINVRGGISNKNSNSK